MSFTYAFDPIDGPNTDDTVTINGQLWHILPLHYWMSGEGCETDGCERKAAWLLKTTITDTVDEPYPTTRAICNHCLSEIERGEGGAA